jgi:hypothetical protein
VDESSNINSVDTCDIWHKFLYFNGLNLNVNNFIALNLHPKNIVVEKVFTMSNLSEQPHGFNYFKEKAGTFYCQYHPKDSIECFETIVFSFKIRVSLVLNNNRLG